MEKVKEIVMCASDKYYDCFSCKEGACMILNDSKFENSTCPFYKTAEQVEGNRTAALASLLIRGRSDLVRKFESHRFLDKGN